jgi:hypothetical protein
VRKLEAGTALTQATAIVMAYIAAIRILEIELRKLGTREVCGQCSSYKRPHESMNPWKALLADWIDLGTGKYIRRAQGSGAANHQGQVKRRNGRNTWKDEES